MTRKLALTTTLIALAATPALAQKQRLAVVDANGNLDALIRQHAAANNLPEDLVRRVIKRESGGNPRVVSAGNYGLMQIKLQTARSMGYTGNAAGLLDANTNMTYAVKYLAGAYRLAKGNHGRGYYYAAKAKGVSVNSLAQANDTYAPATSRNVKFSSRQSLREAGKQTDGFGSSWNFYNRPDSY
jgi:soluble lytic murein transglycosylase-like protein